VTKNRIKHLGSTGIAFMDYWYYIGL